MRLRRLVVAILAAPIGLLVLAWLALATLNAFGVAKRYRIPSSNMEPTLRCAKPDPDCSGSSSDRILVLKYVFSSPERGDVVAFETPPAATMRCGAGGTFVKRVVGLPGERWEERAGIVYINGKRLRESYVEPDRRDSRTLPPRRIPRGKYFVMGDNRRSSCDSREWGSVPRSNVIGRLVAIYWPPGRISLS